MGKPAQHNPAHHTHTLTKLNSLHILEHSCPQRSQYEFPIAALTSYHKLSGVKTIEVSYLTVLEVRWP